MIVIKFAPLFPAPGKLWAKDIKDRCGNVVNSAAKCNFSAIIRDFSEIKRIIANVGNCAQPFDIAQFPLAVCILPPSSKAVVSLLIESAVVFDDPRQLGTPDK